MKSTKLFVICSAVILLMASALYAQEQGGYNQGGQPRKERIFKELNLTPEQQQKLTDNRSAQHAQMVKLQGAMKEKQEKLREEVKNPAATRSTVDPIVNEIKSLQAQIIDQRINAIFAVKQILTPEQFIKFQQMTEKWQQNKKERMQKRPENRDAAQN